MLPIHMREKQTYCKVTPMKKIRLEEYGHNRYNLGHLQELYQLWLKE